MTCSTEKSALLVGKAGHPFLPQAIALAKEVFASVEVVEGKRGDPLPQQFATWRGDYLISYLSQWVIPAETLQHARVEAINFHPGPPAYPGIGCTNFALYNQELSFGATCHRMVAKVDTGDILFVARCPVLVSDSVLSLTERCYALIWELYAETLGKIRDGVPFIPCGETWSRQPYTRKELDALCQITPDMSVNEVARRVRATNYPNMPGPFVEIGGFKFNLDLHAMSLPKGSSCKK